jgi:hypothetical protein
MKNSSTPAPQGPQTNPNGGGPLVPSNPGQLPPQGPQVPPTPGQPPMGPQTH